MALRRVGEARFHLSKSTLSASVTAYSSSLPIF